TGRATSTGPYRKKNTQVTAISPTSAGRCRMLRQPPAVGSAAVTPAAGGGRIDQQHAAGTAEPAAAAPVTPPGPGTAVSAPASAGPTTNAAWAHVDSSALPVTRSSSGSSSATSV